jgi:2-acylglycerol O-acyltransferase 2
VVSFHHGIMMTDTAGFMSKFPSLVTARRDLVASVTLAVPGYRELLMWLGCVDAGKATAKRVLRKGYHLYVLPGGEAEQLMTQYRKHRVYVRRRKGFVKLAIEHGASLVPVYAFGETDMYHTSNAFMGVRRWIMKNLRVAIPLFWGRWGTPVPYPVTLTVVVGRPIRVARAEPASDITREQVERLHDTFVEELGALFEKYKGECGYADAVLDIL